MNKDNNLYIYALIFGFMIGFFIDAVALYYLSVLLPSLRRKKIQEEISTSGRSIVLGDAQDEALVEAARDGNVKLIGELLRSGADINAEVLYYTNYTNNMSRIFYVSETPLTVAAGKGNVNAVKKLLLKGADVNLGGKDGSSPLIEALNFVKDEEILSNYNSTFVKNVMMGKEIVKVLLAAGAEFNEGIENEFPVISEVNSELKEGIIKSGQQPLPLYQICREEIRKTLLSNNSRSNLVFLVSQLLLSKELLPEMHRKGLLYNCDINDVDTALNNVTESKVSYENEFEMTA